MLRLETAKAASSTPRMRSCPRSRGSCRASSRPLLARGWSWRVVVEVEVLVRRRIRRRRRRRRTRRSSRVHSRKRSRARRRRRQRCQLLLPHSRRALPPASSPTCLPPSPRSTGAPFCSARRWPAAARRRGWSLPARRCTTLRSSCVVVVPAGGRERAPTSPLSTGTPLWLWRGRCWRPPPASPRSTPRPCFTSSCAVAEGGGAAAAPWGEEVEERFLRL